MVNFFDEEIGTSIVRRLFAVIQFDAVRIAWEDMKSEKSSPARANVDADSSSTRRIASHRGVLDRVKLLAKACIGSDYDGTIDPLPGVWTAEYFPVLREPLIELACRICGGRIGSPWRRTGILLRRRLLRGFFIGNTVEFQEVFLKNGFDEARTVWAAMAQADYITS